MTAFERSAFGRKNRAIFYQVDRILYVEGGNNEKGLEESFDGMFWRKVFSVFRPDIRLQILPRGTKTNLLRIAETVLTSDSGNEIVALDRDYDGLFNRLIENQNIVYTFGYSFENDCFHRDTLLPLFYELCPVCQESEELERLVNNLISEYCRDVWWPQLADVCGTIVSRQVIDRKRTAKYLESSAYGASPRLAKKTLRAEVYNANVQERCHVSKVPFKASYLPVLSVGHLYAAFCRKMMFFLHNKYSNTAKLTRDAVTVGAITNFAAYLTSADTEVVTYYQKALSRC